MTTAAEVRRGRPGTGARCFGWRKGNLVLDPVEAAAIRQALTDVLERSARPRHIAEGWNAAGLLTPFGNAWRPEVVLRTLSRPRNAGVVVHHGVELDGVVAEWAPIVTRDVLDAAVARLHPPTTAGSYTRRRLATGIARCATCGALLHIRDEGQSYGCSVPADQRVGPRSAHAQAKPSALDAAITTAVVKLMSSPDFAPEPVDRMALQRIDLAIAALAAEKREVIALPDDEACGVTTAELRPRLHTIERRRHQLATQRADVQRRIDMLQVRQGVDAADRFAALPIESQRNLVADLLDVRVHPRGQDPAFTLRPRV